MLFILYAGIIVASVLSVVFSWKHRRSVDPKQRGLNGARMNLSMGAFLLLAAFVQLILFDPDTIRIILGSIFVVIGLFNLFAGLRNYGFYTRMSD